MYSQALIYWPSWDARVAIDYKALLYSAFFFFGTGVSLFYETGAQALCLFSKWIKSAKKVSSLAAVLLARRISRNKLYLSLASSGAKTIREILPRIFQIFHVQRRFVSWSSARLRQGFVPVCDWFRKIAPTSWCRPEIYQSLSYLFPWLCSFIVIVFFFKFNSDPYEELWQTQDVDADKCDNTCDALAACACGLVYGDYKCACPKGFAGSGVVGDCNGKWRVKLAMYYQLSI